MEENEMEDESIDTELNKELGDGKFRLYYGIVKDEKWFNYVRLEKIKGGILTILDGSDDSVPSRMLNLVKGCVKEVYNKDGESITLNDSDYFRITMMDAKLIARKYATYLSKENKHEFTEYFRCPRCSKDGNETYTETNEDWQDLIANDKMQEYFAESQDELIFETILPFGIEIQGNPSKGFNGGTYKKMKRRESTIEDAIDVVNDPIAMKSITNKVCAMWDKQIISIEGMDKRFFSAYVSRNGANFCKKYLIEQEDIDEMSEDAFLGLDTQDRVVRCHQCNLDIGGSIDETNFFSAFIRSNNSTRERKGRI